MLILSRRSGESVVIGRGRITVTVIQVRGKVVSLGIDAPKEIGIRRSELSKPNRGFKSPEFRASQVILRLR